MKLQYRMLMVLLLSSASMVVLGQPGKKGGFARPGGKIGSKGGAKPVSGSAKAFVATNDVFAMNPYQIEQLDIDKLSRQQAEDLLIVALFAGGKYKRQAAQELIDKNFGKQNWAQHSTDFIGAMRSSIKEIGASKEQERLVFDALFSGSKLRRAQAQKEVKNEYPQANFDELRTKMLRTHAGQFIEQFMSKFKKEVGKEVGKEEEIEEGGEEIPSFEKREGGQYAIFKQPGGALTYGVGALPAPKQSVGALTFEQGKYKPGKEQEEYEQFEEEYPFKTHFAAEGEEEPLGEFGEWPFESSEEGNEPFIEVENL